MNLEVWETIKAEELERGMYRTDEPDLSAELDKARVRVDRIDNEHAVEVKQLSQWVVRISNIMFDLGLLPIQDIPQLLKSAQEVLLVVDILKRLQEVLASDASS
jgi:hypothetical protein